MFSSVEIANKIIIRTETDKGDIITNLKLQKLLYYLQGYNLAIFGEKLFDDNIEAWQYGPVVPTAYQQFKGFGSAGLTLDESIVEIVLPESLNVLFEQVMTEYGQFGAVKLMKMTHEEKPWRETFKNGDGAGSVIDPKLMQDFFSTLVQ